MKKLQLGLSNIFHPNKDGDLKQRRASQADLKQRRSSSAGKKEQLAITPKGVIDVKDAMVTFDDDRGLSMGDGLELRIIQPSGFRVGYGHLSCC